MMRDRTRQKFVETARVQVQQALILGGENGNPGSSSATTRSGG
jgi:hypothetical protein